MQCPEFEHRLQALLDERLDPRADEALAAHAARCGDCQGLLAGQVAVLETLDRLKRAGLLAVPRRPRCTRAPRRQPAPWHSAAWPRLSLAVAAAMLLALGIVLQTRSRHGNVAAVARGSGMNLGRSLAVATRGRPAAATSPPGGHWLLEAPRLPEHLRTYRGSLGHLASSLPSALAHFDGMDDYAPGLRNLRASLDVLWQTLTSTVPREARERPSQESGEQTGQSELVDRAVV